MPKFITANKLALWFLVLCLVFPAYGQALTMQEILQAQNGQVLAASTNGLVKHYKFDEGSGTSLTDSVGSNNGTISGATWTTGKIGGALSFDGNDQVTVANQSLAAQFTVSAWVKWNGTNGTVFDVSNRIFYLENGGFGFWNNGSTGSGDFGQVPTGSWQHIAYVYNGSTLAGYINGVSSGSFSSSISTGSGVAIIGNGGSDFFNGQIDELRVYNRALSAQEITDIYTDMGTPAPADTQAPSTPTNLSASAISSSQINLSWTASTDNVGVTGYRIYRNGSQLTTTSNTSYSDSGLTASTAYSYTVQAYDAAGNNSSQSSSASATTQSVQASAPVINSFSSSPSSITSGQSSTLSWSVSNATSLSLNQGIGTVTGTSRSVSPTLTTTYTLTATNAQGSVTANTTVTVSAAPTPDTQAPSTPTNLSASAISSSQINLSWTASTDNVGVTGYRIYRNGSQLTTTSNTSYSDSGLTASTAYSYTVQAYDAAGNNSGQSSSASATTQAASQSGCTGSGLSWTCAAGSTVANIQAAINSASDGATISFAAGNYNWSTRITLSPTKGVTLKATPGTANVSVSGSAGFDAFPTVSKPYRISGFNFTGTISTTYFFYIYPVSGLVLRDVQIDNNVFNNTVGKNGEMVIRFGDHSPDGGDVTGVVYKNTFIAPSPMISVYQLGPNSATAWGTSKRGTANNIFVEDNTFTFTSKSTVGMGCIDGWQKAGMVFRYNTVTNCQLVFHEQGHEGGFTNAELYGNSLSTTSGIWTDGDRLVFDQGGGERMYFNNVLFGSTGKSPYALEITHYRSPTNAESGSGLPPCNGSQSFDGNWSPASTYHGYPCWGQPGRKEAGAFGTLPYGSLSPIYSWLNRWQDGTLANIIISDPWNSATYPTSVHVKANRDYYTSVSSGPNTSKTSPFNGTTGMGYGPIANRPDTCTASPNAAMESGGGVGYWATDQGEWNSSNGSTPDGQLYRCSATNTWTLDYIPYQYPHPLVSGTTPPPSDTTPPVASNIAASNITQNSATITWTTNEPADSLVRYGLTTSYTAQSTLDTSLLTSHSITLTGLSANTTYNYRVDSRDGSGNLTTSANFTFTTQAAATDTQAPSTPTNLSASAISSSQINLSWTASTDNVGVTGYDIYRGGTLLTTVTGTTYSNTGLTANTTYSYTVRAKDAAGNTSAQSSSASATTQASTGTGFTIPASRLGNWQNNVGIIGGIPTNYTNCTTSACNTLYGGTVTAASINAALASAPDNTVVRIPAGTYNINSPISLSGLNNVVLRGAGMNSTIINNSAGSDNIDTGQTGFLASGRAITSGFNKGSTSIVVGSASGVTAGSLVYITQRNETFMRQCVLPSAQNLLSQAVLVTSVSGNTINFTPGLMMDFNAAQSPTYSYANPSASKVGLENFTLNSTGNPNYSVSLWWANEVWFQGVKITGYADSGILANMSNRIEVRKSVLGFSSARNDGYGIQLRNEDNNPLRGTTSNSLIENNLFDGGPSAMMRTGIMNNGGTANVIAYNYITRNSVGIDVWQYQGIFSNHKAHGMYNLYEGNYSNAILNDGYHGSTSHDTYFRNSFHGDAPWLINGAESGNRIMVNLARWSTYHNVIGNVLGSPRWNPTSYQMSGSPDYYAQPTIYRLGYPNSHNNDLTDGVGCGAPAGLDSNVQSTILRHKNYDYFNKTVKLCSAESEGCQSATGVTANDTLPSSMYLASKPAWFGSLSWPAIDPSGPTVNDIPAKVFYSTGVWPDESGTPPPASFTITASAGTGGSISPTGSVTVTQGGSQTFTITPNTGYNISSVLVNGVSVGNVTTYTFSNVSSNQTIAVTFASAPKVAYTFRLSSMEGKTSLPSGQSLDVSVINPASGAVLSTTSLAPNGSGVYTVIFASGDPVYVNIRVKASGYLSRLVSNVNTTASVATSQLPALLAGDLNNDNLVNTIDFSILSNTWNTSDPTADINQDGTVNSIDFALLSKNWNVAGE